MLFLSADQREDEVLFGEERVLCMACVQLAAEILQGLFNNRLKVLEVPESEVVLGVLNIFIGWFHQQEILSG
jgi:hypothetical protein